MGKQTAITDEEIIAALLASTTIAETASKVGLSQRALGELFSRSIAS